MMDQQAASPRIVTFGPYRVIGVRCVSANAQGEFSRLWERDLLPRVREIVKPESGDFLVGLCRCVPDARDGVFEYLAGAPATPEAPIPEGMVEASIAAGTYVVFPVAGLHEIMQGWRQLTPWLEAYPEWTGYCSPSACHCATHPAFELYPSTFCADGRLFIYMPIRKAFVW